MAHKPVLVVEDNPEIRLLLRSLLKMAGLTVLEAGNGKEALDLLQKPGAELPGLILLDLMMPIMNGEQFIDTIANCGSSRLQAIPVVIVTASSESVAARVEGRLRKPINIPELMGFVDKHCR